MAMLAPERAINLLWAAWAVSWWAAAVWRAPSAKQASFGAEALHLFITAIGFLMIFASPATIRWEMAWGGVSPERLMLWRLQPAAGWIVFAVAVVGFAFCWWARITLGALWSGNVTRKAEHHVVETGPYAFVRHPIYTGLILAAFATAVLRATWLALLGAVVVVFGLFVKAKIEEGFLRAELGAQDYDAYAARTPMLFPRPWRPAPKS